MTVVIGTAGHIDHGKTALLQALTGIDADRLPEERRRGMTIDIGFAHLDLDDGTSIDFVDVPGHDALIGNMLVGAGEIDAAMVVVAADDGPRAQTLEHLELLDALGIRSGIAVVTKADLVDPGRAAEVAAATEELLAQTCLGGACVVIVSATTGVGLDDLRTGLLALRDRVAATQAVAAVGPLRLAIDRAFTVRGRGTVVTGSLRAGDLRTGASLRLEPGGVETRARGLHIHHGPVDAAGPGRVAINVAGADASAFERGTVLTAGAGIEASSRWLVALAEPTDLGFGRHRKRPTWPPADGMRVRAHVGTAQRDAAIGRRGREAGDLPDGRVTAILRLAEPLATFVGDRGIVRRPSLGELVAGFEVLDPVPARGIGRRRATPERLAVLAVAVGDRDPDAAADAAVALHGALGEGRIRAIVTALARSGGAAEGRSGSGLVLAPDVRAALDTAALAAVAAFHAKQPLESGLPLGAVRRELFTTLRRLASIRREDQAAADRSIDAVLDDLVRRAILIRDGERLRDAARGSGSSPALAEAMGRLERALDVPSPPDLSVAARQAGCPPEGIRALESSGRILRIEADLAWAAPTFQRLAATALKIARQGTLTPAALRDVTGTSRRYVMPLLEDLNRRGILARTPTGHVPGPRAPRESAATK